LKTATITEVAKEAGVSKSTVSAVLNRSRPVSEDTRSRVLDAARTLNYQPSARGRLLKDRGTRSIGLVIKEAANPFYADVTCGAARVARDAGYLLYAASSEGQADEEARLIDDMRRKGVSGLIISPVLNDQSDLSHLFHLGDDNYPFVLLEKIFGLKANIVDIDNVAASKSAVEFLIREGHTKIVHFAGPSYSMHSKERIEGVRQAFSECHLVFREDTVTTAGATFEDGSRAWKAYMEGRDESDRPTAVTCFNDLVALGVWAALQDIGLRVPEDVSVIGYDDISLLHCLPQGLSTVRGNNTKLGEIAAQVLIRHIEAGEDLPVDRIYLDTELIHRQSTLPSGLAPTTNAIVATA
jgi:LacI family transcriptional regulator